MWVQEERRFLNENFKPWPDERDITKQKGWRKFQQQIVKDFWRFCCQKAALQWTKIEIPRRLSFSASKRKVRNTQRAKFKYIFTCLYAMSILRCYWHFSQLPIKLFKKYVSVFLCAYLVLLYKYESNTHWNIDNFWRLQWMLLADLIFVAQLLKLMC